MLFTLLGQLSLSVKHQERSNLPYKSRHVILQVNLSLHEHRCTTKGMMEKPEMDQALLLEKMVRLVLFSMENHCCVLVLFTCYQCMLLISKKLMMIYNKVERMVCTSLARWMRVCPLTKVSRQMCL